MKRILNFILISYLIHLAIFLSLNHYIDMHALARAKPNLSVILSHTQKPVSEVMDSTEATLAAQEPVLKTVDAKPINNDVSKLKSAPKALAHEQMQANPEQAKPENVDTNETKNTEINSADYFSPNDVDRKALPLSNIDRSMLAEYLYSGLPIKLRLYINASGRMVKIDRIAVLEQDAQFVEALEQRLFNLGFLPAKREGQDVNSYLDVELSFDL